MNFGESSLGRSISAPWPGAPLFLSACAILWSAGVQVWSGEPDPAPLIESPEPETAQLILRLWQARGSGKAAEGTALLEQALAHPDFRVRLAGLHAGAKLLPDRKALDAVLCRGLQDPAPAVRQVALAALERAEAPSAEQWALVGSLAGDPAPGVAPAALRLLRRFPLEAAAQLLEEMAGADAGPRLGAAYALSLLRNRHPAVRVVLFAGCSDAAEGRRLLAVQGLAELTEEAALVVRQLERALADPAPAVRTAALQGLIRLESASFATRAEAAGSAARTVLLGVAKAHKDERLRITALKALGRWRLYPRPPAGGQAAPLAGTPGKGGPAAGGAGKGEAGRRLEPAAKTAALQERLSPAQVQLFEAALCEALGSGCAELRMAALRQLAQEQSLPVATQPLLIRMLRDEDAVAGPLALQALANAAPADPLLVRALLAVLPELSATRRQQLFAQPPGLSITEAELAQVFELLGSGTLADTTVRRLIEPLWDSAYPLVLREFLDEGSRQRAWAIQTLGELAHGAQREAVAPLLLAALALEEEALALPLAVALSRLGPPSEDSLEFLAGLLKKKPLSPLAGPLIQALGQGRAWASKAAALLAESAPAPAQRGAVVTALGALGTPAAQKALPLILPLLKAAAKEGPVREAILASGKMGPAGAELAPLLIRILQEHPGRFEKDLLQALTELGAEALPALRAALAQAETRNKAPLLAVLGQGGGASPEVFAELSSHLDAPDAACRQAACTAMLRLQPNGEAAWAALAKVLTKDPQVEEAALRGLKGHPGLRPEVLGPLRKALAGTVPALGRVALAVVRELGPQALDLGPALLELAAQHRAQGRLGMSTEVLGVLGHLGPGAVPLLVGELRRAETLAAAPALWTSPGLGAEGPAALLACAADKDPVLRGRALVLLAQLPEVPIPAQAWPGLGVNLEEGEGRRRETVLALAEKAGSTARALLPALQKAVQKDPLPCLKVLAVLGGEGAAVLIELLAHPQPGVRRAVAEALGGVGERGVELGQALLGRLGDARAEARQGAAWALGGLGNWIPEAQTALAGQLGDLDPGARAAAAWALQRLNPYREGVVAALAEALASPSAEARQDGLRGLQALGPLAAPALPALLQIMRKGEVAAWQPAKTILGSLGPRALQPLLEATRDPELEVRQRALEVLCLHFPSVAAVGPYLLELCASPNEALAAAALSALGRQAQLPEGAQETVKRALARPEALVRSGALQVVARHGARLRGAYPGLVQALVDPEKGTLNLAAQTVVVAQGSAIVPELVEGLRSVNPDLRRQVVATLPRLTAKPEDLARALGEQLAGGAGEVRKGVLAALAALGARAREALPGLERGLEDPEPEQRVRFAAAMLRIDPALERPLSILRATLLERSIELRVLSLEALLTRKEAAAELLPQLRPWLREKDRALGEAVEGALRASGEAGVAEVIGWISDTHPQVRCRTLALLAGVARRLAAEPQGGAQARKILGLVAQALRDTFEPVRMEAVAALAAAGPGAAQELTTVLPALSDPSFEVRGKLCELLGSWGEKARPAAGALGRLLEDPKTEVRAAALKALGQIGGAEELVTVAKNQEGLARMLLQYLTAQEQYFAADWDADGQKEFATTLFGPQGLCQVRSPENLKGLLPDWTAGVEAGPPGAECCQGYLFRILTAQGKQAQDGERSYLAGKNLTGGHALLAVPSQYGKSGRDSFLAGKDGRCYRRDLGPQGAAELKSMERYDPGPEWRLFHRPEAQTPESRQVAPPGDQF